MKNIGADEAVASGIATLEGDSAAAARAWEILDMGSGRPEAAG